MNPRQDPTAQALRLLTAFSGGYQVTDETLILEYAAKIKLAPAGERYGIVQAFIDEESKLPPVSAVRLAAVGKRADSEGEDCPHCSSGWIIVKVDGVEYAERRCKFCQEVVA